VSPRDSEIVTAARTGSPGAFAELHAIYSRRLYNTIIAITKTPEDAEDALQETFLRVHLAIHAFEGRSSLYTWLTQIAINSALRVLRKRRTRPEVLFDPQPDSAAETVSFEIKDSAPNPEQACELRQRQDEVLRAMHKLSACLRGTIRMRMATGWSVKEISQALNISESAVKTRLHRARLRLSVHVGVSCGKS
jgi:RNA polymerase sigma-70 factor (ECF subfamily)